MDNKNSKDVAALTMSVPNTDKDIVWIIKDGKRYIPLISLARMFDMDMDKAERIITRNDELFNNLTLVFDKNELKTIAPIMVENIRTVNVICLKVAGSLQWITLLNYKRYKADKKDLIVNVRNWLMQVGEDVIEDTQTEPYIHLSKHQARYLTVGPQKALMQTMKEKIIPANPDVNARWQYQRENIANNELVFGKHKKGIRDDPDTTLDELMRLQSVLWSDISLCELEVTEYEKRRDIINTIQEKYLPPKVKNTQKTLDGWF